MKVLLSVYTALFIIGVDKYVLSLKDEEDCRDVANLTVSFIEMPPYVMKDKPKGALYDFAKTTLQKCFHQWKCDREFANVTWQKIDSLDELYTLVSTKKTDIAFAFPPSQQLRKHENVAFVQILKAPGFALVVDKANCQSNARHSMWRNILSSWPLFMLIILLSCIFGVFIWILEAHSNQAEFPRSFIHGCYEGFWWAFISMTAVGYGDKVPRSIAGRMFSVIWILIGVILLSVVTATITSILTVASVDYRCNTLQGKKIAVFSGSEAERVARREGASITVYTNFDSMSSDVKQETMNGIYLDQFKAYYYLNEQEDNLRVSKITSHSLPYTLAFVDRGHPLLPLHNNCFVERLENAHYRGEKFVEKYINLVKFMEPAADNLNMFTRSSKPTQDMLLVSGCFLLALLILGAIWEVFYKHKKCNCGFNQAISMQRLRNYSQNELRTVAHPAQDLLLKKLSGVEASLQSLTNDVQWLKAELQTFSTSYPEIQKEANILDPALS